MRPHHKKQFHQMCLDLTGFSTSYKPEDTVNKKRLREESGSNSSGKAKENAMYISGFPQALENLENHKKRYMHGKIMEFEKTLNNHGKIMEFCEII